MLERQLLDVLKHSSSCVWNQGIYLEHGPWQLGPSNRTTYSLQTVHTSWLGNADYWILFTLKGRKCGEDFSNTFFYCRISCTSSRFFFRNNQSYFLFRYRWRRSLPNSEILKFIPARFVDVCRYFIFVSLWCKNPLYTCNLENFQARQVQCSKWTEQ